MRLRILVAIILALLLTGCSRSTDAVTPPIPENLSQLTPDTAPTPQLTTTIAATGDAVLLPSPTTRSMATAEPPASTVMPSDTTSPGTTPTAIVFHESSSPCGMLLPLIATEKPLVNFLQPDETALAALREIVPEAAVPALDRMLDNPETVGLAAYQVGQETEGAYLNADAPMPLASVVKIIHLVAYVEAVVQGRLDPNSVIPLEELNKYYLPGLDLGAHNAALRELEETGRILPNPPSVRLEEVPWMMIRHSSNAATDYLHFLLGQETIEETAVALGLSSQTAPCPFLGQFLIMNNHTRQGTSNSSAILGYLDDPVRYGHEVMLLAEAYSQDAAFRAREQADRGRASMSTQRLFVDNLNPQASAREYAGLMALIAQNGLSDAESSFMARRYLEWPMRFPVNQELFSNLGYKNGAMPGVLTILYYAYRSGETTPVVVALFFRDLPNGTYQRWRRNELAHDEFARWLLYDPTAIPALKRVLNGN